MCVRVYLQELEDVVFVSVNEGLWGDPQGSVCLIHGDDEGEEFSMSKNDCNVTSSIELLQQI